jgi:hypothetical protein
VLLYLIADLLYIILVNTFESNTNQGAPIIYIQIQT